MTRRTFVYLVVLTFVSPAFAAAKELWQVPWIEVRSPHFVIVSALSESRTIELANDLEAFRYGVQVVTKIDRLEERVPTTVYVLPRAVEKLGFRGRVEGYLVQRMRANYAVVIPAADGSLASAVKHEYVHFLLRNRDGFMYPRWFNEGFAEVLSTMTVGRTVIEYGDPPLERIYSLHNRRQWMPFGSLLEQREFDAGDGEMFYAQSWLLVHYLMNGRLGRRFAEDTRDYLRSSESGTKPAEAFERAYGVAVNGLESTLRTYLKGLKFMRLSLTQPLPDAQVQVLPVGSDSIAADIGLLAYFQTELDEAKRCWDAAIALNTNNVIALIGLGNLLKFASRFDEAVPYYEKAITAEPLNAYAELEYAEYFLTRAQSAKDSTQIASLLTEARRHFARSYKLDPSVPETLAMNGSSYLFEGESAEKALQSLLAAEALLPSHASIKLLLAKAYVQKGDRDNATLRLHSLIACCDEHTEKEARELLQELDGVGPAAEPQSSASTVSAP